MTDEAPDAFAVHATLDGCIAEVRLNDVPVVETDDLERIQATVHATPWIVDGDNELRLVVHRARRLEVLPAGAVALDREAGPVFAWARVLSGFYEDAVPDLDRDETEALLRWSVVDDPSTPATAVAHFTASGRPRWAWQDARVLDPASPEVRADVVPFVRAIHAAFAAGDGGAVLARMPSNVAESVRFGVPPGVFAGQFLSAFARSTADADYAVAPLDDADVVLRPVAGGRVLEIRHTSGGHALRASPAMELGWSFPLRIAWIGAGLEIVRAG